MPLYNNGYPASFQQYYPPQYQHNNGIIWVQGEAGAKSYLVAPNTTVQLCDSETQSIYIKSADASGMPSLKILDYTIRENAAPAAPVAQTDKVSSYATKAEIDGILTQIKALREDVDKMMEGNDNG